MGKDESVEKFSGQKSPFSWLSGIMKNMLARRGRTTVVEITNKVLGFGVASEASLSFVRL